VVTHCGVWTDYSLMWCLSATHPVSHHLCIVFNGMLTWHGRVNIFFCKCSMFPSNDLVSIYNSTTATHSGIEKISIKTSFNTNFIVQTIYLSKQQYMYVLLLSVPPGTSMPMHIYKISHIFWSFKSVGHAVSCDICWLW